MTRPPEFPATDRYGRSIVGISRVRFENAHGRGWRMTAQLVKPKEHVQRAIIWLVYEGQDPAVGSFTEVDLTEAVYYGATPKGGW